MTVPTPPPATASSTMPGWVAILAGLLALVLAVVGCTAEPGVGKQSRADAAKSGHILPPITDVQPEPPADGPVSLKVGESFDYQGTATATVLDVTARTVPTEPEWGEAPVNGQFLKVTVSVTVSELSDVADTSWFVRDAAGVRYEVGDGNSYMEATDDALTWVTLNAGEQVTGTLTFDVPVAPLELAYAPAYGPAVAVWALSTEGV